MENATNLWIEEPLSQDRHTVEHNAYHDIIDCLTMAMEARDAYTGGHSSRVGDMTYFLAREMGLRGMELEAIHIAAHLHDIGKIGVSEKVLNKPGLLTADEMQEIRSHPEIGWRILSRAARLTVIAKIVLYHHERWDGGGYPSGLKKEAIPMGSRIVALADAIDAMTSDRPYRSALSWEACLEEVRRGAGRQFDPQVVNTAIKHWQRLKQMYEKNSENKGVCIAYAGCDGRDRNERYL